MVRICLPNEMGRERLLEVTETKLQSSISRLVPEDKKERRELSVINLTRMSVTHIEIATRPKVNY
jgi:hypothetical protein